MELPGRLEEIEATADDGARIRAWLVLPGTASEAEPAPLLLWVHGGPMMSWNAWSWRWNPWLMAARGYAVLLPDPALSTGYGEDFVARGHSQWGGRPYTDLMAITDAAVARADIDAGAHRDDGRFLRRLHGQLDGRAHRPVPGDRQPRRALGPEPVFRHHRRTLLLAEDLRPSAWASPSATWPTRRAATPSQISTPMLVIHGDKDYRVPVGEALRLWWDLQGQAKDVKYLYFPDENHWILKPGHVIVWYETVLAFLAQHVLGEPWQRPELLCRFMTVARMGR